MTGKDNYGVIQTGGVSNVGNQAVGPMAHIEVRGDVEVGAGDFGAAAALLDELLVQIQASAEALGGDPAPATSAARTLREEMARPDPDGGVARTMLERLGQALAPVPALMAIVAQIGDAIRPLLSG